MPIPMPCKLPKLPLRVEQRRGQNATTQVVVVDATGDFWAGVNRTDLPEAEIMLRAALIAEALGEKVQLLQTRD